MVAMFEIRALFGSPSTPGTLIPHPDLPLVILPINVVLSNVVDLTDPEASATIDTNAQELTGDWRSYSTRIVPGSPPTPHTGLPPTHQLGDAAYALTGLQGMISFSATLPDYKILVVFPDRLKATGDFLQYDYDDSQGTTQIIRIP